MTAPKLISRFAACCWIPLFGLRCEEERRPEYRGQPCALLDPDDSRRVWQVSTLARQSGVRAGQTVSQAIGLCPTIVLCEADPVYYHAQFTRLLQTLTSVSPVVEPAELGRAYVGVDGLERLVGGPKEQVEMIKATLPSIRLGWGHGKFVSWVAASRARPGDAVIVREGTEREFLSPQPLSVLPLDPDTHLRLRQLGLRSLGELAALPEEAVVSQFGRAGRKLWRLAAGVLVEPIEGRAATEPIVMSLTFFSPVSDQQMLVQTLDQLIDRGLKDPRRAGLRVRQVRVRAELDHGGSWRIETLLKEPAADRKRIAAPLKTRLEQSPPPKAVERLTLEFTAFAPGTTALQLFARDAGAAARAGRRRALRNVTREITTRLKRPMLYHVVAVQPGSRLPERRYALMDYEG